MKSTISCFVFLFLVAGISAQEIKTTTPNDSKNNEIAEVVKTDKGISSFEALQQKNTLEDDAVCYSEISKVTFYEALLHENNFDIQLKDSHIALRNTEDIITNNKERISYTY